MGGHMYKITKKELVDSIAIPMMTISKKVTLTHKVKLSRPNLDGSRDYFHKEFPYPSKYKDIPRVSTVRLTHSSILTIENKNTEGADALIINVINRDFIVESLSEMIKIFKSHEEADDLFIEHEDKFIVNPKFRKYSKIAFEPYQNKKVVIQPHVITYADESRGPQEGVLLHLDSRTGTPIEIPIDVFKALIKLIDKFDFHIAGLTALTYLQSAEIGNHEIEVVRLNVLDFDTDLQPEYRVRESTNTAMNKLETRKTEPPSKNKGW
jgi:hypothetical protein